MGHCGALLWCLHHCSSFPYDGEFTKKTCPISLCLMVQYMLPFGKRLQNYGTSPYITMLIGKINYKSPCSIATGPLLSHSQTISTIALEPVSRFQLRAGRHRLLGGLRDGQGRGPCLPMSEILYRFLLKCGQLISIEHGKMM